jgi:hypothetical protein
MNPDFPTMYTYRFITDESFNIDNTTRAVKQWAKRRDFPIEIVEISEKIVNVQLAAPDCGAHNRSVNSLSRILQRQLNAEHSLFSALRTEY